MTVVTPIAAGHPGIFALGPSWALESGEVLEEAQIAYRSWGRLNDRGDNAVLVFHALTGSARLNEWWPGLLGPGRAIDPREDFVLCANILGGCYGSTGPASAAPDGRPWGRRFPSVCVRDMVRAQLELADSLGVQAFDLVIGASLGGMQVLESCLLDPDRVRTAAVVASSGRHSPWAIAWNSLQRELILRDPDFCEGDYEGAGPSGGLDLARRLAMLSYRSDISFALRFARDRNGAGDFEVQSYLAHHGKKLVQRFDANSYLTLSRAMDEHDVGRERGTYHEVLGRIDAEVLCVSIDTDHLYPPHEQEELARHIPRGQHTTLPSLHGHDGFLIEVDALDRKLREFRENSSRRNRGRITRHA